VPAVQQLCLHSSIGRVYGAKGKRIQNCFLTCKQLGPDLIYEIFVTTVKEESILVKIDRSFDFRVFTMSLSTAHWLFQLTTLMINQ